MGPEEKQPIDDRIKAMQLDTLVAHMPVALVATALNGLLVFLVMRSVADRQSLLVWGGAMLSVILLRGAWLVRYRRCSAYSAEFRRSERDFLIGVFLGGISWGAAGVLLQSPNTIIHDVFMATVLVGMGAGSIATYSVHLGAFMLFFISLMTPIVLRFLSQSDDVHLTLGVMGLLFMLYLCIYSRLINRAFLDSFRLRFENLALVSDLTQQKNALVQAGEAKSRFFATASHDLRQPLHALGLLVAGLEQEQGEDKRKSILGSILACLSSLRTLFDSLLDVSKLDAGVIEIDKQSFSSQNLLQLLHTVFAPLAEQKGLRLRIPDTSLTLYSDPMLLERIVRNLLSNAIKYTASGGVVEVELLRQGRHALLTVSDSGSGIPPSAHEKIFEEFSRLEDAKRDGSPGLGLGLSIVKRLATLLQLELQLDSQPGTGSRFSLKVPLGDPASVPAVPKPWSSQWVNRLEGKCVLVVDDEPEILAAMEALLRNWGAQVWAADSLAAAQRLLRQQSSPPDILVFDFHLRGGVTGEEAIGEIRRRLARAIPAILITGDTTQTRIRHASRSQYLHLYKPVRAAQLRMALERALTGAGSENP